MKLDSFGDLKKEVLERKDRFPHLSLDNTFVAWCHTSNKTIQLFNQFTNAYVANGRSVYA